MNPGIFDQQQRVFFERYKENDSFRSFLSSKAQNDWPHIIDYFRLVELEKKGHEQAMQTFFAELSEIKMKTRLEAAAIRSCFSVQNSWSEQLMPDGKETYTTAEDIKTIDQLCRTVAKNREDAEAILVSFFRNLLKGKRALQENKIKEGFSLETVLDQLPDQWYADPWYYLYVQYFGTDEHGNGDFRSLMNMLDYLDNIGIKNLYLLPHYESPYGDAGYDISEYKPAKRLGGEEQFKQFLREALRRGFRIATDLVFNHTSAEHEWFLKALEGNSRYFDYYLKCPDQWADLDLEDIRKQDEDGHIYLYLPEKDASGNPVISRRTVLLPDVDQTLWLRKRVKGLDKDVLFYREFYPFQVDLDLQNPKVINELFGLLSEEISSGILGKRTGVITHWIKKPGTSGEGLKETYALQKLIKQFLKHLCSKAILLPEVVAHSRKLKEHAGAPTTINGQTTTTMGDALQDFQLQGMLREMMYFQKTTPFWSQVHDRGEEEVNPSMLLLPIEHHDETFLQFIQEKEAMRDYIRADYNYLDKNGNEIRAVRGLNYKNGMAGGARYADCLNRDQRRIAIALLCLYLMPASPVIYYGTEIGAVNQWTHMNLRQEEQYTTLRRLLGEDLVGPGKAITFESCKDPRELQRGPIPMADFQRALKSGYPAIKALQALNRLRKEKSALRSFELSDVDTWHESILGMIRLPQWRGEPDKPVLALVNLSEKKRTAQVPFTQVQRKTLHSKIILKEFFRIEGTSPLDAKLSLEEKTLEPEYAEFLYLDLEPYSGVLYEVH